MNIMLFFRLMILGSSVLLGRDEKIDNFERGDGRQCWGGSGGDHF